jgi:DNA repair photolyase
MNSGRSLPILHGRGTAVNPPNRFETLRIEADLEHVEADEEYLDRLNRPTTQYLVDTSKSIIASNDSPDVGFSHSINPYRGCQHGCIYCYARPGHEYWGFSAGLDFETRIMVKPRAAELLREELASPRWNPTLLAMSGVTDCYQPIEKTLRLTRGCLEVLAECRNPVGVITKNHLVTRDIDLLAELSKFNAARVFVSVTTLDEKLTAKMEPRTSVPKRRLAAIEALTKAGITVGVLMAPVVPGLTDHEIPSLLKAAAEAGAMTAGYTALRLPGAVAPLFEQWLEQHFPDRKAKVLNRVRSMRGGKLNDPNFGSRMSGQGI